MLRNTTRVTFTAHIRIYPLSALYVHCSRSQKLFNGTSIRRGAVFTSNAAPETVWRPGSVRTPPEPWLNLTGRALGMGGVRGRWGEKDEGKEREEEGQKVCRNGDGADAHFFTFLSYPSVPSPFPSPPETRSLTAPLVGY